MVGLRKGHCYTRIKRAYTRHSKVRKKDFIKSIPINKIVRYDMGDPTKQFNFRIDLITKEGKQIRHNALESTRTLVNRHLVEGIGTINYFFKVRQYPHHVLRENKMLTGAGADRMQTGMQKSFGRAIGVAAQIKRNKPLFSVFTNKENLEKARIALQMAPARLPGKYIINLVELKK
jgi:large subunit ribosomal protein L10e